MGSVTTPSVPEVFEAFGRRLEAVARDAVIDGRAARDLERSARLLYTWADKADARLQQQLSRLARLRAALRDAGEDLSLSPVLDFLSGDEALLTQISPDAVYAAVSAAQAAMLSAAGRTEEPATRASLRRTLHADLANEILLEAV